jgi:hypothetical protein
MALTASFPLCSSTFATSMTDNITSASSAPDMSHCSFQKESEAASGCEHESRMTTAEQKSAVNGKK